MAKMNPQANRKRALLRVALVIGGAALLAGCSAIRESRGYITDPLLSQVIQPGIDNQQSVEGTLGRPTFTSQFGEPTWYYVSSVTGQRPFTRPRIREHSVLAVRFDEAGKVIEVDRSGVELPNSAMPASNWPMVAGVAEAGSQAMS